MDSGLETAPAGDPASRDRRRPLDTATKVLLVILAIAVVESFVHYTDNTLRYDDYTGIDAAGKAVLIFTHEPQENDARSVFEGQTNTVHSTKRRLQR